MHRPITRVFLTLLLALATSQALASDGGIQFSGAITTASCAVTVGADIHLEPLGPGCADTARMAEWRTETVGNPDEGLTLVTVQLH